MNRDSFLFYRSYYEAIKNLPDSTKLEVYNAVMEFGLYSNEIELHDEFARSIFTLIKPVLETNNKRFKGGKSGGRPKEKKPMVLKNENLSKTYGSENSGKNENLRHLWIKDISSDEDIGYRIKDKDISSDEDDIYLECIKIHSCPPCPADASGSNPKDSDLPTADAEIAPNDRGEISSPPGSAPPPVGVDLPSAGRAGNAAGIDRKHNALGAETFGPGTDQFRITDRRRVQGNLVRAGVEHSADVLDGADPPADSQRDENLLRSPADHVIHACAVVAGRRDIEEDNFVRPLAVVFLGGLDGISRINQIDEIDALDDPAVLDVETRYDSLCKHRTPAFPEKLIR